MLASRERCKGFLGGYSPNPCGTASMDPGAGEGLCLLSIAGCLSVLFVRDRVCFWGRPMSVAAKLLRSYCAGALLCLPVPLTQSCLALAAEAHPAAPLPVSSPVLVLSEAPKPLSAEALGPALQQLNLAAPTTLQVRMMESDSPSSASVSPLPRAINITCLYLFPSHQAPSALPAELRPPKLSQEQAGKALWQDANGYLERDSSRGKGRAQLCRVGLGFGSPKCTQTHWAGQTERCRRRALAQLCTGYEGEKPWQSSGGRGAEVSCPCFLKLLFHTALALLGGFSFSGVSLKHFSLRCCGELGAD